ncbi:hypothetical protein GCM10028833_16250 [Glycomyces tarimensis]
MAARHIFVPECLHCPTVLRGSPDQLRRYRPMIRYVVTWNSEVNGHMIDINEAVGYRRFTRELAVQKQLA